MEPLSIDLGPPKICAHFNTYLLSDEHLYRNINTVSIQSTLRMFLLTNGVERKHRSQNALQIPSLQQMTKSYQTTKRKPGRAAQQCWTEFEPLIAILTHSFLRITPFCLDVGTCWTFLGPHSPWGNHFSLYQLTGPTHARQPSSYPKPKFPLKFSKSFIRYHLRALLI